MIVDIKECDLNEDYFHFTNRKNVNSILSKGLIAQVGTASKLVDDSPNVSISRGGKGIIGIINSFIYKFENEWKISDIPEEYKKYFTEITNFNEDKPISKNIACMAIKRKLQDEIYFRVKPTEQQIENAKIDSLSAEFDIKLQESVDVDQIDIITDSYNKALTAYEVAEYVYERAKGIEIIRSEKPDFFNIFEIEERQNEKDER